MKLRLNYVSNSSSASYIIPNWSSLPEEKKNLIKDYDANALKVWQDHGLEFKTDGRILYLSLFGIDSPLDFGIIDDDIRWHFKEQEDGSCILETIMQNFDMHAWLDYNGIKFEVIYED